MCVYFRVRETTTTETTMTTNNNDYDQKKEKRESIISIYINIYKNPLHDDNNA